MAEKQCQVLADDQRDLLSCIGKGWASSACLQGNSWLGLQTEHRKYFEVGVKKVDKTQWILKQSLNTLFKVAGFHNAQEWDLPDVR